MPATLPDHVLIAPRHREAIGTAVGQAAEERRCVLWLDDLERFLGAEGLTRIDIARVMGGEGHHRVILATMRAAEQARFVDSPTSPTSRGARPTTRPAKRWSKPKPCTWSACSVWPR
ncbi:hypothetical protein AB0H77_27225 [Streptomyces sp. NPDC050844]|uniref:hypothetical protein n=1 Tax=Streptomyces sp. NPDC050844 TaxID=3155790 RepID=UPI0033C0EAF8